MPAMIESQISTLLGRRRASIQDLANQAGIAYSTAHALYHGTSKGITFDVMNRLCAYLGVQPGDLFTYRPDAAGGEGTSAHPAS
jgi:putative transcriptional regulator